MIDKATEVKHKLISFAIKEDEEMDFLKAYVTIDELLQENKAIPAKLLKTFISLCHDPDKIYKDKFDKRIKDVIRKYELRFSQEPSIFLFHTETIVDSDALQPLPGFPGYKKNWKPQKMKVFYSWRDLIIKIGSEYFRQVISNSLLHEDYGSAIKFFTRKLNNYLTDTPASIRSELLLTYRQAIVAFLVTEVSGFKAAYGKSPTNRQMASGVRYYYNLEMSKKQRKRTQTEWLTNYAKDFKIFTRDVEVIVLPK